MNTNSCNLVGYVIGLVLGMGVVLAVLWVLWLLWCTAVPAFFPIAPAWLASPGYWSFVGIWILVSWIGRAIFGGRSSN